MIEPAVEWAQQPGPPNWVFVAALLSTPHLWAGYVKRGGRHLWNRYTGSDTDDAETGTGTGTDADGGGGS